MTTILYLTFGRELEAMVVQAWCWQYENKGVGFKKCTKQKKKKTMISLSPGLPEYIEIDENDDPKYNGSQVGLPDFACSFPATEVCS